MSSSFFFINMFLMESSFSSAPISDSVLSCGGGLLSEYLKELEVVNL